MTFKRTTKKAQRKDIYKVYAGVQIKTTRNVFANHKKHQQKGKWVSI
ncbi:MAG: hypothetical protein ACTSR2_06285 [Candidatus Hodarchaeales archaeon]